LAIGFRGKIMKAFIRTLAASIAIALAVGTSISASAAGDQYSPDRVPLSDGQIMVQVVEDSVVQNESGMAIQPPAAGPGETRGKWITCTGTNDPKCDLNNLKLDVVSNSILPNCTTSSEVVCLESLELAGLDGLFKPAKFIKVSDGGQKIPGDSKWNYVEGSSPSLYESEVVNAGGTNTYAVAIKVGQVRNPKSGKFEISFVNAVVIPYRTDSSPNYSSAGGTGATNTCAYYEDGKCGIAQDFAEGTIVRATFHLPKTLGGWFLGRLKNPNISITSSGSKTNMLTVAAEPVVVPRLGVVKDKKKFSTFENYVFNNHGNWGTPSGGSTGVPGNNKDSFKLIENYRKELNDTATGIGTFWSLTSTSESNGNRCLDDKSKVLGIVTTNSTGYDGTAPAFTGGFLNYKVAGLHYAPGGEELNLGVYDLVMRSETARCLYGWGKAPLSATVSVNNDKGTKTMATTVVKETKDGWLKMAAYGFTFSKKTIKVKITKKKK
jgi:hypothetical protein